MAAISNTLYAAPFTKAFLAKHNNFAARVELRFDFAANSLSLMRVNFWESKEVVHLDCPLADDPVVPSRELMFFYQTACMLAVEWSRAFPIEKLDSHTYRTIPWNATLIFYTNSVEETFLFWMMYDLYPKEHVDSFNQLLAMHMYPSEQQLTALQANMRNFETIISKVDKKIKLTPEENILLYHSKSMVDFTNDPKEKVASLLKIQDEMKKIQFPQELTSTLKQFSLQAHIEYKQHNGIDEKNKLYLKALKMRSTSINEQD